jgi:hypothetical protein
MGDYTFDVDSRVEVTGPDGEYRAVLTDRWAGLGVG